MVTGSSRASSRAASCSARSRGYVGLRNYRDVLNDPVSRDAMRHTLEYVLLAVSLELVLGIFVAVTLHRVFRGRGFVLAVLILPWALPSVVSGVLWRRVFDPDNGLLNALLIAPAHDQRAARLAGLRPRARSPASRSCTCGACCRWSA